MKIISLLLPLLICSCAFRNTNRFSWYTDPGIILDTLEAMSPEYGWISGPDSGMIALVQQMDDTSRSLPEIHSLHERLLQYLTLPRAVALERRLIQLRRSPGFHHDYSRVPTLSGRIIDRFYSREWERVTADSTQLRGYLRKGALLDGYIDWNSRSQTEPRYLDRFRDAAPELVDRLGRMFVSEEDPLVRHSIAAVLAFHTESTVADAYVIDNIGEFTERDLENFNRLEDSLFYQKIADQVGRADSPWEREMLMQILERGEPEVTLPALRRLAGNHRTAYVSTIYGGHSYHHVKVSVNEYAERLMYGAMWTDLFLLEEDSGATALPWRPAERCRNDRECTNLTTDVIQRYGRDYASLHRLAMSFARRRLAEDTFHSPEFLLAFITSPQFDASDRSLWIDRLIRSRRSGDLTGGQSWRLHQFNPPGGFTIEEAGRILLESPDALAIYELARTADILRFPDWYRTLVTLALDSLPADEAIPMILQHSIHDIISLIQSAPRPSDVELDRQLEEALRRERTAQLKADTSDAGTRMVEYLTMLDGAIADLERIRMQDSADVPERRVDLWSREETMTPMLEIDPLLHGDGRVNYQRLYDHLLYPFDPSFGLDGSSEHGLRRVLLVLQVHFRSELLEVLTSRKVTGNLFGEQYRFWMQNPPGLRIRWPDDPTTPVAGERRFWLDFLVERGYAEPVTFRDAE